MKRLIYRILICLVGVPSLILSASRVSLGYSVLTHEAIVDSNWDTSIKQLLIHRYRALSPQQLREARSYAYGGAIIQDMGYYPLGSKFFTDLVHYVRSGDFIENLLKEAQDPNEYAFALGALAHYAADNQGHSIGVNRTVPVLYPKLRKRFGSVVTYANDPAAHLKAEFGFDVLQLARARYLPDHYHDAIGFRVSKRVLEQAFKNTYGFEIIDIFTNFDLAVATYRRAVSTVIPEMSKVAWETKKDEIMKASPGMTSERFVYKLNRTEYEQEWGKDFEKPGVLDKALALMLRALPKIGPLRPLAFKPLNAEAEKMFVASLDATVQLYRQLLAQTRAERFNLANKDFDTGHPTRAGEYEMADRTYAKLVHKLASDDFRNVSPDLRQNVLAFYAPKGSTVATNLKTSDQREVMREIEQLKGHSYSSSR